MAKTLNRKIFMPLSISHFQAQVRKNFGPACRGALGIFCFSLQNETMKLLLAFFSLCCAPAFASGFGCVTNKANRELPLRLTQQNLNPVEFTLPKGESHCEYLVSPANEYTLELTGAMAHRKKDGCPKIRVSPEQWVRFTTNYMEGVSCQILPGDR